MLADRISSRPLPVKVSAVRAELPAIEPAAVVDGLAANGGLDALLAGVEELSDHETEALLAAGMGESGDD